MFGKQFIIRTVLEGEYDLDDPQFSTKQEICSLFRKALGVKSLACLDAEMLLPALQVE